jgi:hypothetical protein
MSLEYFKDDLDGSPPGPPYQISAGKLDRNFARCYPKDWDGNDKPYTIKRDEDGYIIQFPFWPPPGGRTHALVSRGKSLEWLPFKEFDVCENGKPVTYSFCAEG